MNGRDLLVVFLLVTTGGLASRGRGPPPLGPPHPAPVFARPVDLNHATVAELVSLDGIGPKLALRIVDARPFSGVDDLLRVRGIGARRLAKLRPRLRVTAGTRANVLLDE